MIKSTAIGASLPENLFIEFNVRADEGFPGGKTGLIKESLRMFFEANPLNDIQKAEIIKRTQAANNIVVTTP